MVASLLRFLYDYNSRQLQVIHSQPATAKQQAELLTLTTHTHAQHEVNTICFCATDDDDVSHDDPGTQRRELRNKQAREHSTGSTG